MRVVGLIASGSRGMKLPLCVSPFDLPVLFSICNPDQKQQKAQECLLLFCFLLAASAGAIDLICIKLDE